MEATRRCTAEEERRLKLLEYLAAKGKLKPQNCKPYLKDCTNLQNKRPQESSKQIYKPKNSAPNKGSHSTFGSSKSKTSNAGSLPHQPSSGKIPTHPTVSTKRLVSNPSSRNPPPPKCSLPRARPEQRDHAGRTLHPPSVRSSHAKKQESREESDVTLTVILTKKHGEKPEICVVDETSPATRGQCASGPCASVQGKNGEPCVSQQVPATKAVTQATKSKSLHDPKTKPPASKPVSVASSGHIRIVSRLSLPEAKSANERSFLIKSSRNDGSKQPLNVRKSQPVNNSQKTCPTAKYSSAGASSTMLVHKKISTGPVSAPSRRPQSSDCTSKRISYSQNTLYKPIAPRKSIAPAGCKEVVQASKDEGNQQNREHKQQGVTGATKEAITKASNLTATDTVSRLQTPRMTAEDRKKKLQEWLNSKGKTYKRPPMLLPPKRPTTAKKPNPNNRSLWEGIEEEEEMLALSKKISQTLSECLELIEKGVSVEDIHSALDKVPEAKKFAKYWVCKARLLEREGICDVMDVYKQGVQFGATPLDELREVVSDIMKNTNKKTKVVTFGPLPAEEATESEIHEDLSFTPFTSRTEQVKTPCTGTGTCDQGSAVKLQIASLSSKKKVCEGGQDWKRLTPVRRSVRIHHSAAQYPEVVQEHDTVVSCLEELLDKADAEAYLYMRNEALPEEAEHNLMSLRRKDPTEDHHEGPA